MTSAYNYNTQINQSNKLLQKYLDKNLLGMTSACLNPVLYGFLNESYKKEFKVDFHLNSNFLHTCWEHIVKIIQFGSILFFSVYPPITYFFICLRTFSYCLYCQCFFVQEMWTAVTGWKGRGRELDEMETIPCNGE